VKYVRIISACDMTKAETGSVVDAAETVYIAFGSDPGSLKVRELDLSEEWSKELHAFLQPFLSASHEPGDLVTPVNDVRDTADKRAHKANLVRWAQANGYSITRMVRGGYYVPVRTKQAYAHHLAGNDHLLTEENGLQPDCDPATGNSV
jgi:hypothetical protein